jgi:ketosteroid isomerase-like protein
MPFTGPVEDRELIRELLAAYADAVTRQDLDGYLTCWHEAGRRSGPGGDCTGTAELRAQWQGVFGAVTQMAFFAQAGAIEIDGDVAAVRSHCLEVIRLADGNTRQVVGEYTDSVVRVDGRWVFAERAYTVLMG